MINSLISFCVELYLLFDFFDNPQWEESMLLVYRLLWLVMHGGRIWFILAVNEQILEQVIIIVLSRIFFNKYIPRNVTSVS